MAQHGTEHKTAAVWNRCNSMPEWGLRDERSRDGIGTGGFGKNAGGTEPQVKHPTIPNNGSVWWTWKRPAATEQPRFGEPPGCRSLR